MKRSPEGKDMKNFAKFTGKYLSNCLFTKVAGLQSERFSKGDSIHMISWELCKNFNNYLFAEDLRMTGSMLWNMAFSHNCAPINLHF